MDWCAEVQFLEVSERKRLMVEGMNKQILISLFIWFGHVEPAPPHPKKSLLPAGNSTGFTMWVDIFVQQDNIICLIK